MSGPDAEMPGRLHLHGMTTTAGAGQGRTVRIIHAAFAGGVAFVALGVHLGLRPQLKPEPLESSIVNVIVGLSLLVSAVALTLLRGRVPKKSTNESADLFWTRASLPALVSWAALEGGGLLAVVAYFLSGSTWALAAIGVALFGLLVISPGHFERA